MGAVVSPASTVVKQHACGGLQRQCSRQHKVLQGGMVLLASQIHSCFTNICNVCRQASVPAIHKACTAMNKIRRGMRQTRHPSYLAVTHVWDASQELF